MEKQSKPKQIIVIRKDLNMRKGKIVSQSCHAVLKVLLSREIYADEDGFERTYHTTKAMHDWLENSFTKICCYVESEQELVDLYNKAKEQGILCAMIEDAGLTEFHGVVTKTCIAIGPEYPEKLDPITGHLKLL
jgi:peptidyl-tRNA hydrolase, PTH2 family